MSKRNPKTLEEAFKILDDLMKDELTADGRLTEEVEATLHFGLGLWIRNNWLTGAHAQDIRPLFGISDLIRMEDMVSDEILSQYVDHCNKKS